ncbi:hypothetical protein NA57DRAFT_54668 [Rhizodiscina lignyota]|uniref:Uncharacterized protein n=1 Tax=Rhizodiscina lignyota TaxID=1504668 RepID=A0A9P4IGJ6_9PEZI|nr:hypothetical protein NA57DRAFT_54668 [Rhizodiscina lignyota]
MVLEGLDRATGHQKPCVVRECLALECEGMELRKSFKPVCDGSRKRTWEPEGFCRFLEKECVEKRAEKQNEGKRKRASRREERCKGVELVRNDASEQKAWPRESAERQTGAHAHWPRLPREPDKGPMRRLICVSTTGSHWAQPNTAPGPPFGGRAAPHSIGPERRGLSTGEPASQLVVGCCELSLSTSRPAQDSSALLQRHCTQSRRACRRKQRAADGERMWADVTWLASTRNMPSTRCWAQSGTPAAATQQLRPIGLAPGPP